MEKLSKILFIGNIYSSRVVAGIAVDMAIGSLIFALVVSRISLENEFIVLGGVALLLFLLLRQIAKYFIAWRWRKKYKAISQYDTTYVALNDLAIMHDIDQVDALYVAQNDASSSTQLLRKNTYHHYKGARWVNGYKYYSVYSHTLSRPLPNILFDSVAAKRRQFKRVYLSAQKISLEGNFDRHFTTVVPINYHIDALSFITPEVMQLMLDAKDYDIEIKADQVLLYGPLPKSPKQLASMQELGSRLAAALDDNIDTYADSYLQSANARIDTTAFARVLLKNPYNITGALKLAIPVIFVLLQVVITAKSLSSMYVTIALIAAICIFGMIEYVVSTKRANRKQLTLFEAERRSTRLSEERLARLSAAANADIALQPPATMNRH